ncbi:group XVI phospholipase A2-like protein [Elysia marginata]|uniref:Group XVI phospholipase A2-like protein n=1 Tax=Elysia marginata TaxID=1093978 RepID=A0AAV4FUE1_9GAST|nr:group XVI phospholipase A2-like protein [Elysia marginata]
MLGGEDPPVYVNNSEDAEFPPFPPDEIVKRALSKRGKSKYSLTSYNCESFVNLCRCGVEFSRQVKDAAATVETVGSVAAAGAVSFFVSR